MRHFDELMELRAERMSLLQELNTSSNPKRQSINKRLMQVSKRIQRLAGVALAVSCKDDLYSD
jgi:hypothetical protein